MFFNKSFNPFFTEGKTERRKLMAQLCEGVAGTQLPRMSVRVMRIRLQRLVNLAKKKKARVLILNHAIQPGSLYSCLEINLFLGIGPGGCSSMN